MPAAREQAEERRLERRPAGGRATRRGRRRWSTGTSGSRRDQASAFAAASPTSSAPISPGPCVTATRSTSSSVAPRVAERLADDGRDELEVAARGDLGHDAAVPRVQVGLRGDDVGQDLAVR